MLEISAHLFPNTSVKKCWACTNHQSLAHLASTIFIFGKLFSVLASISLKLTGAFLKSSFIFQDAQLGVIITSRQDKIPLSHSDNLCNRSVSYKDQNEKALQKMTSWASMITRYRKKNMLY